MMATVSIATWQARLRRLADRLTAEGDLHDPRWRDAVLAVPRHEFVPRYYEQDTRTRPARWVLHEPGDEQSRTRWLDLVYSPTTLITELATYADRGVQVPVCSSTKPDLMIRMLQTLDVHDGHAVLEIGTGTGYNAALLCHRLGSSNVCSIDIDPALVTAAGQRLSRLGYTPTLVAADGAAGLPGKAPFDRIIATCSVRALPPAWIHQLRPGGMLLVHVEGPLGAGNLLALCRDEDEPAVRGRFLPWWGCFLRHRPTAGPTTGTTRPRPVTDPPAIRHTTVNPAELEQQFQFLAQLYLPAEVFRSIRMTDDGHAVTYLAARDGSWCQVTREPDHTGRHIVREAGPTSLWTGVETAWTHWNDLGTPACHEFGLTATPEQHHVWLRDPTTGPHWPLPVPGPRQSRYGWSGAHS